jgi:signal transduction histidine kinase
MQPGRIRWGLRLRVALALALACLLVVGALGITLYAASEEMEEALITQLVSEEMDYVVKRHRQDPGYAPQPSSNLQSYVVRDAAEQDRLPPFLVGLAPGAHEFYVGTDEYHVLVREAGGVRYLVAYEVGLHEQREREFKLLIVLAVLTVVVVSLGLGYWLSGMLVSQVADLVSRVERLKPGESRETLSRPEQDAEVAMLARAFDRYQESIERLIRREQEFTANASHELRTPLTAIRTSCELLLADPGLPEKARSRVAMIDRATARMTEQIQMLLFLARGESLGAVERVVLSDCVAEAADPCRGEIARKGLALESTVAPDAALEVNYQALRLVLSNVIRNAVQYTDRGTVRIAYENRRLSVADTGRGIGSDHLPRVFERHFRGDAMDEGTGIGLAIVQRICEQHGWRIEVESAPGKGSTFSVVFP